MTMSLRRHDKSFMNNTVRNLDHVTLGFGLGLRLQLCGNKTPPASRYNVCEIMLHGYEFDIGQGLTELKGIVGS